MKTITRIIVEGADQQGKTTVCNFLSKQLGWKVIHFPPAPPGFNYHSDYILDEHTISDRNFLSEIVYSKIRNEKCKIKNIPQLISDFGPDVQVIYVDRGDEFVYDNRDELFSEEEILQARNIYRVEMWNLKMKKMLINPDHATNILCRLLKQIKCKN